jgi:hypothetical protein
VYGNIVSVITDSSDTVVVNGAVTVRDNDRNRFTITSSSEPIRGILRTATTSAESILAPLTLNALRFGHANLFAPSHPGFLILLAPLLDEDNLKFGQPAVPRRCSIRNSS